MKLDNIIVVNTFGIGDVLFTTPLLKEIKRNLPDSKIHFMCNKRNFELLKNDPDITNILIYEKDDLRNDFKKSKLKFLKNLFGLISDIKKINVDAAIDLTLNYQTNLVLMLSGIRTRIGFNYKNRGKLLTHKVRLPSFTGRHVVEHYLDLLKFLKLNVSKSHRLWSYTSPQDKSSAEDFLKDNGLVGKRLVGIVAGGGNSWGKDAAYRRWGSDNFAYIGKQLAMSADMRILVFGMSDEKKICDGICREIGPGAISLCGITGLGLLIELISRCRLIICNECGPLHIAVSQDVETISIFGPVDPKEYGPYPPSQRHKVVEAEDVICRPCYKNFKYIRCDTFACLKKIDKERVLRMAKRSLGL